MKKNKQITQLSRNEDDTDLWQMFTGMGFFKVQSSDECDPQALLAQIDRTLPQLIQSNLKEAGFLQIHQVELRIVAPQDVTKDAYDTNQTVTWFTIVLVRRLDRLEQAYDKTVIPLFANNLEFSLSEIEKNDEPGSNFVLSDFVSFDGEVSPVYSEKEVEHQCSSIWQNNNELREELRAINAAATSHSEKEAA